MVSIIRKGIENRKLVHKNERCVGCGICSETCPTSALNLGPVLPIARGLLEMDYIKINDKNCVLCGLCSFACPFEAIVFNINDNEAKDFQNYPNWDDGTQIDKNECIFCGKCEINCPRDAIIINRQLPDVKDLVKGEAKTEIDKCINCKICVEMCPSDAITIETDVTNINATEIVIDESKCIYCKICQRTCPEDAIKIFCTTCMNSDDIPKVEITGDIFLDEDICVNCSWCEHVCPTNAATTVKPFEGEIIRRDDVEDIICKGDSCHACLDVCPCNAVEIINNKSSINPDFCVLCGACQKACPQNILKVKRTSMKLNNIKSEAWQNILGSIIGK